MCGGASLLYLLQHTSEATFANCAWAWSSVCLVDIGLVTKIF